MFSHKATLLQVFASLSLVSKYHSFCFRKPNKYVPTILFYRESGCQTHAVTCGAGTGVFLLIRVSLLVDKSFFYSPYILGLLIHY